MSDDEYFGQHHMTDDEAMTVADFINDLKERLEVVNLVADGRKLMIEEMHETIDRLQDELDDLTEERNGLRTVLLATQYEYEAERDTALYWMHRYDALNQELKDTSGTNRG